MSFWKKLISTAVFTTNAVTLFIGGAIIGGFIFVIVQLIHIFTQSSEKYQAIIGSVLTVVFSLLGTAWFKHRDYKESVLSDYRKKKSEVYQEFITRYSTNITMNNKNENNCLYDIFTKYYSIILLCGSDEVLEKYCEIMIRLESTESVASYRPIMVELFVVMRKDLGYDNSRNYSMLLCKYSKSYRNKYLLDKIQWKNLE